MVTKNIEIDIKTTDQALEIAPVIHIDGAQGFFASPDVVRINLIQDRMQAGEDAPDPIKRVVCARLVMSPGTLLAIADWFGERAREVKEAMDDAREAALAELKAEK